CRRGRQECLRHEARRSVVSNYSGQDTRVEWTKPNGTLMISDAAVGKTQLLARVRLIRTLGCDRLIQTHAQRWAVGRCRVALFIAWAAALEQIFPVLFAAAMRDLLDAEIRGREIHMQRR